MDVASTVSCRHNGMTGHPGRTGHFRCCLLAELLLPRGNDRLWSATTRAGGIAREGALFRRSGVARRTLRHRTEYLTWPSRSATGMCRRNQRFAEPKSVPVPLCMRQRRAPSRMALEGSPRSARQSLSRLCILTRAGLLNARDPPTPPLLQVS